MEREIRKEYKNFWFFLIKSLICIQRLLML
jgi:hypothetical protein